MVQNTKQVLGYKLGILGQDMFKGQDRFTCYARLGYEVKGNGVYMMYVEARLQNVTLVIM